MEKDKPQNLEEWFDERDRAARILIFEAVDYVVDVYVPDGIMYTLSYGKKTLVSPKTYAELRKIAYGE